MRRPRGWCCDARGQARRRAERLGVDARGVDSDRRQARADLVHERRGPTQVCLGVVRRLQLGQLGSGETARGVEVAASDVVRARTAVVHVRVCVRERGDESPSLCGERVLSVVSCGVQAPDLAIGVLLRQRVKHGEHGGGSDPGTDQQHGCIRLVEDEGAARCRDFELVTERRVGCADSRSRRHGARA